MTRKRPPGADRRPTPINDQVGWLKEGPLGDELRRRYGKTVDEGVPDRFKSLLEEFRKREAKEG